MTMTVPINKKMSRRAARAFCGRPGQVFTAREREYVLCGEIGDGAIGIVRKARHQLTGEEFAVKFLAPEPRYIEQASFAEIAARFRREGDRGVSLNHPNLVKILAYEENEAGSCFRAHDGPKVPFIVMEYVRGQTLESFIRGFGHPPRLMVDSTTLYIAHQIAEALVFLHERRLVHRDVKPANIFLSSAQRYGKPVNVKLGDFGVCKWGDFRASIATGSLTVTGQRGLGTMKYMSPEQALTPREATVRADIYSFGVTLFETLTSQLLPSPHHVFQITQARLKRGSVGTKLMGLGLGYMVPYADDLFGPILDMFLTGPTGRPTSTAMRNRFMYLLGLLEGNE